MKPLRILIADDHALLRHGLELVLAMHEGVSVIGGAEDGAEAVRLCRELMPDIVIMDLSMPVLDGVEATRQIHHDQPDIKILILTTFGTSVDVARAIQAGASGALVKDAGEDELIAALREVAAGGVAFSPEIKSILNENPVPPELTKRQQIILKHTVEGLASDAIAANLGISSYSVNQQLDAIRKKLGAANRTEAVAIALRKHLLKI